jgi:putative SOS response-associated peptidase YedK
LNPADGFYECKKVLDGKIPHSIGIKDDSRFVFAGLWEGWKDPANDERLYTSRFPADRMKAWPMSPRVDTPKNNDADIIPPMGEASI